MFNNNRPYTNRLPRNSTTKSFVRSLTSLGNYVRLMKNVSFVGLIGAGAVATAMWTVSCFGKAETASTSTGALDAKEFREFSLKEKIPVSPNTSIYRFALPSANQTVEMPVTSYLLVAADVEGESQPVIRPYTPISYDQKGYFDLLIKSYPTGKLSKKIGELQVGDKLKVKGPGRKLDYLPNMKKHIGMIAGGTGITPMLQVLQEIAKNPNDKTEVTLLFGNQTASDILLKEKLDDMAAKHKNIKINYLVSRPDKTWRGDTGHVDEEYAKKHLPPPSPDTLVFVCGPPAMVESISGQKNKFEQGELKGVLKKLGYTEDQVYKF